MIRQRGSELQLCGGHLQVAPVARAFSLCSDEDNRRYSVPHSWTGHVQVGSSTVSSDASSLIALAKISVCRSISADVVSGHINAMLWNGVRRTPRFRA